MRNRCLDCGVRAGLGRSHKAASRTRSAIGVVVRMVERSARFFDMGAGIRSLASFK
jgi:hypothetical protein